MQTRETRFVFRHVTAVALLLTVDLHQRFRRLVSRAFVRILIGALSIGILAMVFTGLYALRKVTRSMESLVSDSMIGVEASVSMRAVARELQLEVLRAQIDADVQLKSAQVDAFERNMRRLLISYETGAREEQDKSNIALIKEKLDLYLRSVSPIRELADPRLEDVHEADERARDLVRAVEVAYQFNRKRIRLSADEAGSAARQAISISNDLWWGFGLLALLSGSVYFAYRWLSLPEDGNP